MPIAPPLLWGVERDVRELLGRCGCRGGAARLMPFRHQERRKPLSIMLFTGSQPLALASLCPSPPHDFGGWKGVLGSFWAGMSAVEVLLHGSYLSATKNIENPCVSCYFRSFTGLYPSPPPMDLGDGKECHGAPGQVWVPWRCCTAHAFPTPRTYIENP